MKIFTFRSVLHILILITIFSCNKEAPESYFLKLETISGDEVADTLYVDAGEISQSFSVKSNGSWNIIPNKNWVSVHPDFGNGNGSFNLLIENNETLSIREVDLSFLVKGEDIFVLTIKQKNLQPSISVLPISPAILQDIGGVIEFTIEAESEWSYTISDGNWLTEKSITSTSLTLEASENTTEAEREANVLFSLLSISEVKQNVKISQERMGAVPIADLLDLVFKEDGTAEDISTKKNHVSTLEGTALTTLYSNTYERYIAQFDHGTGNNNLTSGFYKIDYSTDQDFKNAIADGHTTETLFKLDLSHELPNVEQKIISSHQSGGTGLMIGNNARNNSIIFLPHIGNGYVWTDSNIRPERGKYYHVVGVWNKVEEKSFIYINGELKGTQNTSGNFNFASDGSTWFGVGADPSGDLGQSGLKGDVAIARVYDKPLQERDVEKLWQEVEDYKVAPDDIQLLGVSLISKNVKVNFDYTIKGEGFQAGDKIKITPMSGAGKEYLLVGDVAGNLLSLKIPADFYSGRFRFVLVRGSKEYDMGFATLTVVDEFPEAPGVIAHRGYWKADGAAKNSIASLAKAQELDIYGSEFDVWITTDGEVVVCHDPTIDGIKIETATFDDLKNVTLSNGEKIPTLNDYLIQGKKDPSTKLILEIKSHSSIANNNRVSAAAVQMVKDANMTDQVEYIAFSLDVCKKILELQPNAIVAYLGGDQTPQSLNNLGIKGIDYNLSVIKNNKDWITQAQNLGMTVNVWTVNAESDLQEVTNDGVDYITTDAPVLAKQVTEEN